VAELADAPALGAGGRKAIGVRVPSSADTFVSSGGMRILGLLELGATTQAFSGEHFTSRVADPKTANHPTAAGRALRGAVARSAFGRGDPMPARNNNSMRHLRLRSKAE
jgi:hypothetical protein